MDTRDEQRAWLAQVIAATGIPPTTLAQRAGLSATTLTRFLNSPEHASALSARTIAAVEKLSGIPYGAQIRPGIIKEDDATPFEAGPSNILPIDLKASLRGNALHSWTLNTRALETAGYQPGDILIVDLNEPPAPGDVVCFQLYDFRAMHAETLFRLYQPPFLYAATMDRLLGAPILIDNNVGIKGPVVMSVRPRQRRLAA